MNEKEELDYRANLRAAELRRNGVKVPEIRRRMHAQFGIDISLGSWNRRLRKMGVYPERDRLTRAAWELHEQGCSWVDVADEMARRYGCRRRESAWRQWFYRHGAPESV